MRLQEDKIYALQDYLSEYQQLVCQYRSENEALKEQMQDGSGSRANGTSLAKEESLVREQALCITAVNDNGLLQAKAGAGTYSPA